MTEEHSPAQGTRVRRKTIGTIIIGFGIGLFAYSIISAYLLIPEYMKLGEDYWDTVGRTGIFTGYLWALSFPIASIFLVCGVLFRANIRSIRVIIFMISCFVVLFVIINVGVSNSSPFFGVGGILIELFFLLTIWNWAKKRADLRGEAKITCDLRIIGYMFFALTAWFMCGLGATIAFATNPETMTLFTNSPETQANAVSILYKVMICFVFGWFFVFLSDLKTAWKSETSTDLVRKLTG